MYYSKTRIFVCINNGDNNEFKTALYVEILGFEGVREQKRL